MLKLWKVAGRNASLADRQKINVFDIYSIITKASLQRQHCIHKNLLKSETLLPLTNSSILTRKEISNSKVPSHLPPDPEMHSFKQSSVIKHFAFLWCWQYIFVDSNRQRRWQIYFCRFQRLSATTNRKLTF